MARKPFRFGLIGKAQSREEWIEQAKKAEELGYASFLASDHLYWVFSPIAALQAAASATTTLRIGSNVFSNDFWHPVPLAREAATLDLLSWGRFELGIGAGYFAGEYAQAGIPFASAKERIARLEEAVQVITGLFREKPLTFSGHYYTIQGLSLPQPLQRPRPPLYMGCGGKLMLSAAARHADIVGIVPRASPNGDFDLRGADQIGTAQKVAWVREAAGSRFARAEYPNPDSSYDRKGSPGSCEAVRRPFWGERGDTARNHTQPGRLRRSDLRETFGKTRTLQHLLYYDDHHQC